MPKGYRDQFQRVPTQAEGNRVTGTIAKIVADKGFGFITDTGGVEYFFHKSALREAEWESIHAGQHVSFVVRANPKGPRAEDVSVEE